MPEPLSDEEMHQMLLSMLTQRQEPPLQEQTPLTAARAGEVSAELANKDQEHFHTTLPYQSNAELALGYGTPEGLFYAPQRQPWQMGAREDNQLWREHLEPQIGSPEMMQHWINTLIEQPEWSEDEPTPPPDWWAESEAGQRSYPPHY